MELANHEKTSAFHRRVVMKKPDGDSWRVLLDCRHQTFLADEPPYDTEIVCQECIKISAMVPENAPPLCGHLWNEPEWVGLDKIQRCSFCNMFRRIC